MSVETILSSSLFSSETKVFYKASLKRKHRRSFERGMRNTPRWQDEQLTPLVEGLNEHDMHHIFALAGILSDIVSSRPYLASEVNL